MSRIVQIYKNQELTPSERQYFNSNVKLNVVKMQGNVLPHFYTDFGRFRTATIVSFDLVKFNENDLYLSKLTEISRENFSISIVKEQIRNNEKRYYIDDVLTTGNIGIYRWELLLSNGVLFKSALFYADPILAVFECSNTDFDQDTDIFSFNITRTDTYEVTKPGTYSIAVVAYNGEEVVKTARYNNTLNQAGTDTISFDLTGLPVTKIEWSGTCEGLVLFANYKESNAISAGSDFELRFYDDSIIINSITASEGTATLKIEDNKIKTLTSGTLFNLELQDTLANNYRFTFSEGFGHTVHCVKTGEKAIISGMVQVKQSEFNYNNLYGVTCLESTDFNKKIFVPYSETKTKIYVP